MNEENEFALVPRPPSAVEKAQLGPKRILSGMVVDTLALARNIDLDALVLEGKRIQRRQGMTPEDIRAFDLFHRAALGGHAEAQFFVASCYQDGDGVIQNFADAVKWWRKAADQGLTEAQYGLARCYDYGIGVPQDYAEAAKWYRNAAQQGLAEAQRKLGLDYEGGRGVPQDHAEAVKWYRKAAEQGDALAQYFLAGCYDKGADVPQDYTEAAKWYKKAAEQRDADAQNSLGIYYEAGQGVSQDYKEAVKWFTKAADQGLAEAQNNLIRCYQEIVFTFSDFLASHAPLIGDCSLLPYPKKTVLYGIYAVKDDYETTREATTNQDLRESCDKIISTLCFLLTRLAHDWQEIKQEDKEAIAKLKHFASFPDWALSLKTKYLDDERAAEEAAKMAIQVIVDKTKRERIRAANAQEP